MSARWTVQCLCSVDRLRPAHIQSLVGDLRSLGFDSPKDAEALWCMSADGSGSLAFDSIEAATQWLADGEGLLPLERSGIDLNVSVHRRDGILMREMAHLPDEPMFDVVALTTPERGLQRAWDSIQEAMRAALMALPFAFGFAFNDDTQEAVAEFACVHRRIASNRFPAFLPWLAAVPEESSLSSTIEEAALVVGRTVVKYQGAKVLTLSDAPWDRPVRAVLAASTRWKEEVHDRGC